MIFQTTKQRVPSINCWHKQFSVSSKNCVEYEEGSYGTSSKRFIDQCLNKIKKPNKIPNQYTS